MYLINSYVMASIDWNLTIDTIKAERCILCLGPEIFNQEGEGKLEDRMLAWLDVAKDPKIRVYEDGLFFFRERQKRTATYLKIRRFFEEEDFSAARSLMEKIARIPFHFIILSTPDNLLLNTFRKLNFDVKSGYYWKNHAPDEHAQVPNARQPLVYNMLGNIEHPESLVLTHDDLYDYLESIFRARSMPEKLRYHIISEAQNLLFVGIPFDRWYMQIILRMLNLHKDEEFMRFATEQELSEEVRTLCRDEFKINFVPNNCKAFIEEIYSRCEQEGILRTAGESTRVEVDRIKSLIAEDDLEGVLNGFKSLLSSAGYNGAALEDDLTLLTNRRRRLQRKTARGILSKEESDLEANKIREALLELLHEAETIT